MRLNKKILIDANPVVPILAHDIHTGIGRTCLELIKGLDNIQSKLNFQIELITQNLRGISAKQLETRFKTHHIYLRNTEKYNRLAAKFRLRELLASYDLMHITHNYEIVADASRCIVTAHDAFYMKFDSPNFNYAAMRKTHPDFLRACRHIITCSEYSKKDIIETMDICPDKITVIPWGIDHNVFNVCCKETPKDYVRSHYNIVKPYFVSISCDEGRKRTPALIDAYIELENPQNDLVLVWKKPPESILKKIAHTNRIHILSGVTDDGLKFLYNAATAAFNPSAYEGFGLPILEAMACGCPSVTCKNSSLPEVGQDIAIYIDEPINKSLYEVMKLIDSHELDLSTRCEAGVKHAKKFTWEANAAATAAVYETQLLF